MTLQEFTERTLLTPSEEEFKWIHDLYMNTDLDKDHFCKDFKKHGASHIVNELFLKIQAMGNQVDGIWHDYERKETELVKVQVRDERIGEEILRKAYIYQDNELMDLARELLGRAECVRYAIEKGLAIWDDDDKEYVLELIAKNLKEDK